VPAMSFAGEELYADLPAAHRRLLDTPPLTEKKLLELGVTWPGLAGAQARVAGLLRVFVITWDPLEHQASRPEGFATLNADHDGSELVVYLPIWSLVDSARTQRTTICAVIGTMAGSAVATAASIADTPSEAVTATRRPMGRGRTTDANDLLADRAGGTALGAPVIDLVSPGWEAIGLGAITDIVKHAIGPVDLDRSPVALAAAAQRQVGCPACAGRRFGFPADLAESQARMCPPHRVKAIRSSAPAWPGPMPATPTGGPRSPTPPAGSIVPTCPVAWRPSSPTPLRACMSFRNQPNWSIAPASSSRQPAGSPAAPTTSPSPWARSLTWPVSCPTGWSTSWQTSAVPAWAPRRWPSATLWPRSIPACAACSTATSGWHWPGPAWSTRPWARSKTM